jgi:uncharacterized protein YjbJ (UPF0337 family)
MNRDRIDGAGRKAVGAVKEAAGKITGDKKLQMRGAMDKAAGTVQNAAGKAEDKVKTTLKRH